METTKCQNKFKRDSARGFTLVEMIVTLAIFSLIMVAVAGLFFHALRAHRTILAKSQMLGESSYNLEHIGRGLRMAKKTSDSGCLSAKGLNFEKTARGGVKFQNLNSSGTIDCVEYYLGYPGEDYGANGALMESRANAERSFDLPLTSPAVDVVSLAVYDYGWAQNDDLQPRTTLHIQMRGRQNQTMDHQITISQRDLDIEE